MDYSTQDVRDIVRELLKYPATEETLYEADAATEKEYNFDADHATAVLNHFATLEYVSEVDKV